MRIGGQAVLMDLEFRDDSSSLLTLGMESRSILKSIQTEQAKLSQSSRLTRSDLHYFRARHNYYRLSLLRLPVEERSILEPILGRFFERISTFEKEEGSAAEKVPPPFLQPVEPVKPQAALPQTPSPYITPLFEEVISQLQLVRLALSAESSPEAKKILCDGVDRVILRMKTHRP